MNIIISKPQCFSAQGKKENQEDSMFPPCGESTEKTRVFMVCDGMGGHEHGEVASACVAETIGKMTSKQSLCSAEEMKNCFEAALQQAYHNLDELDHSNSVKKMGTTLTFLAICLDGIFVAHIGDSRVYQLRPGKGIIFQSRDHSLVNDLIAAGELKEEDAKTFPQRNIITRAIQPHQEYPAKATYNMLTDVCKGDLFFLCCDGVLEQLDNKDLCKLLLRNEPLKKRLSDIENTCLARNTRDNNTAYLIEITEVENKREIHNNTPSNTETMSPELVTKKWKQKLLTWTLLIILVLVTILLLKNLITSSNKHKFSRTRLPKIENTNGIIQRNKK